MFRLVLYVLLSSIVIHSTGGNKIPPTCDNEIYCDSELLKTVQMAKIYKDSKTFVDMNMLFEPAVVLANYKKMMDNTKQTPSREYIQKFVNENFKLEDELDNWTPTDFKSNPSFMDKITKKRVKDFAKKIVAIWPKLGRKVKGEVRDRQKQHSLIYVPNGFIIPGGRFREFYYWDSYWILKGLLLSEMYQTAQGMLDNFLHMVKQYGFVPNGGRVYYLNRSQPPLLLKMVDDFISETNDQKWLQQNIRLLEKECEYWMGNKSVIVEVNGKQYKMFTYKSESKGPRPESYSEDVESAAIFRSEEDKQTLYNELKAAAQSGWDFSSRWIFGPPDDMSISYTKTSRVVPVDLNAILYGSFHILSEMFTSLGYNGTVWSDAATKLKEAIQNVLWDETDGTWYDYDIVQKAKRQLFFPTNLTPLWTNAYDLTKKETMGARAAEYLSREGIPQYKGGIPSSKVYTNQQWDMPNAWPPLQSIVMNGLRNTGEKRAKEMARNFLRFWVTANIKGFDADGALYEKYDAKKLGKYGGGGEYSVQTGFGWTNGVVLNFIHIFYTDGGNNCRISKVIICLVPFILFVM